MFIEVCDDVLRKALNSSDEDNEKAVETLRHLSWSIRRNYHLVHFPSIDENDLENLRDILNSSEAKAICWSFSKRRDLQKMKSNLQFYASVSFDTDIATIGFEGAIIHINPKADSRLELFQKSYLLTENLLDSEFYQYFARAYQKSIHLDECIYKINYYPLQGGGSSTGEVYIYECQQGQHFCLAILDSDKKWPNYKGYGQTANTFEEHYKGYLVKNKEPITCYYHVMENACEIENLIPHSVLSVFSTNEQKSFISSNPNALPWLDIKKGFDYCMLFEDDALKEWKQVFPLEIDWEKIEKIKSVCKDKDEFKDKIVAEKLPELVKPWGKKILEDVLRPKTKKQNKYDLKKVEISKLPLFQQEEWGYIGRLIFSWCCCYVKTIY